MKTQLLNSTLKEIRKILSDRQGQYDNPKSVTIVVSYNENGIVVADFEIGTHVA